jgi:hypothetical protein
MGSVPDSSLATHSGYLSAFFNYPLPMCKPSIYLVVTYFPAYLPIYSMRPTYYTIGYKGETKYKPS